MQFKKDIPDGSMLIGIERAFIDDVRYVDHHFSSDHDRTEEGLFSLDILRWDLQIFGLEIGGGRAHEAIVSHRQSCKGKAE